MANTLNNFGLAEKILTTKDKWCTANIDVKISSAEIENIKSEYIRSGANVFGLTGTYGDAVNTVTIPAGIYEIIYKPTGEWLYPTEIDFYYCRGSYDRFEVENGSVMGFGGSAGNTTREFNIGSSAVKPGGSNVSWLDYLVYVPNDVNTSKTNAEKWYSQMHPYVSCKHQGTKLLLTPEEIAKLIAPCSHEESDVYCTKINDSSHNVYCSDCHTLLRTEAHSYDDSGYCFCNAKKPIPGHSSTGGGSSYQCFCDAVFNSQSELEEHQIDYHEYRRCDSCGKLYYYEDLYTHECSGSSGECNHDLEQGTIRWYEAGEGYHKAVCTVCDAEIVSQETCNYIDYRCEKCGAGQIIGYCSACDGEIRYGSDYVDYNGSLLHSSCSTGDSGGGEEKLYSCGGYLGDGQYCNNSGPYGETCTICWQQFTND